jgi:hypothetical protein
VSVLRPELLWVTAVDARLLLNVCALLAQTLSVGVGWVCNSLAGLAMSWS